MEPDPLIPYFTALYDPRDFRVPMYRALVKSEIGLENLLQKLPPTFDAREFRLQNSLGRAALEDGAWDRAELNLLQCKTLLRGASEHVEDRIYAFLLLWANLPLAELYQVRAGKSLQSVADSGVTCTDMLQKAMVIRKEMLDCAMVFQETHKLLVKVCKSWYATAQYEYGDSVMASELKDNAVQRYVELLSCNSTDEGRAHLCALLWCDHYYSGNFDVSLRWIQEANQLWRKIGFPDWVHFQNEVQLLMKLGKSPEAAIELEDSRRDFFSVNNAENIPSEFATDSSGLVIIPISHPIMMRPPVPVGSWLGLVQANLKATGHECHLRELLKDIFCCFKFHLNHAQKAYFTRDWKWAIANYEMCREFVRIARKVVNPKTYDWLLLWVDLVLAYLYQYHGKKLENSVEIWKEMKNSAVHQMLSDEFLTKGYVLNLDVAEYEWMRSSRSEDVIEIIQRRSQHSKPYATKEETERELCFWLYFHHYTQGNYEDSLKWLLEAKKLREEHCPDHECFAEDLAKDYFCCEYAFLRCEADLWMRLKEFEKAKSSLEVLLKTGHVLRGSPRVVAEAKQWLHKCESQIALSCNRVIDNLEQEEIRVDDSPSSTGCIVLPGAVKFQLVQSKIGLEHHLHKLPVPIHLAYQRHSSLGRACQQFCDWENAVFNFEWCKELLNLSKLQIEKETYEWLIVWADVPLVDLYEFRKMQYRKALDLRREMLCMVQDKKSKVYITLLFHIMAGMYQCAVSDHPEVKDVVIHNFTHLFRLGKLDDWACEERCLFFLYEKYSRYGNFEASLHYIRQAKKHLPEHKRDVKEFDYVFKEVVCLICLRNYEEAEQVVREHWAKTNEVIEKLPVEFQVLVQALKNPEYIADNFQIELLEGSYEVQLELWQLRLKSLQFENKNELEEAVQCHKKCLEIINQAHPIQPNSDNLCDYGHTSEIFDLFRLGQLHMKLFLRRDLSTIQSGAKIKDHQQNQTFLCAVQYFEKCIELSSPQMNPLKIAQVYFSLVQLYGAIDEAYGVFIFRHYNETQKLIEQRDSVASTSSDTHANSLSLDQSIENLTQVTVDYLEFENPISRYGTLASVHYTSLLYTLENKKNIEGWIEVLERHSWIYAAIQSHYYRRAKVYTILNLCREDAQYQEKIEYYNWMAFLYAERERTRVLLYQIESDKLKYPASLELWSFDVQDHIAVKALRQYCKNLLQRDEKEGEEPLQFGMNEESVCSKLDPKGHKKEAHGGAVFVQYSPLPNGETYLIYVVDLEGNLHVTHTRMEHEREVKRKGSSTKKKTTTTKKKNNSDSGSLENRGAGVRDPGKCRVGLLTNELPWAEPHARPHAALHSGPDSTSPLVLFHFPSNVPLDSKTSDSKAPAKIVGSVEKSLNKLYKFLEPKVPKAPNELVNSVAMLKELEFLYEELIEPIAVHLSKMDEEHKLILAPSQLLTKVPFAALRNPQTKEYLIQRHTIALTSSLRALKISTERLQELHERPPTADQVSLGSIVALGHPAYKVCSDCHSYLGFLDWSAKEVESIAELFGERTVVKLLWEKATAEELRDWTARPARQEGGFRQVLVHIGSHATVLDDTYHGKNVLHLACPLAKSLNSHAPPAPVKRDLPGSRTQIEIEDDYNDEEVVTGFDDIGDNDEEASEDNYSDEEATPNVINKITQLSRSLSNLFIGHQVGHSVEMDRDTSILAQGHSRSDVITNEKSADDSSTHNKLRHDLKAEDIWSFEPKWMAELVVLSACSSSRGKRTVEGVLSLTRAFMMAGVPCVVASLWKVDDFETVALMKKFYEEMRKGSDVSSALRSSMIHHMLKCPIKDWAPFIASGVPTLCFPKGLQQNVGL